MIRVISAARCLSLAWLLTSVPGLQANAAPLVRVGAQVHAQPGSAPTDAYCRAQGYGPCYSPQEIRKAYGLNGLIDSGLVGAGQTIVIIDSFGSPTLAADLATFDTDYGLPAPPSLKILAPLGTVPFDPNDDVQTGWAFETTLDVEWAHAIAPGASIVVLTSPVAETEGVTGLPEFLALEKYALDHHLGKIISQSWSATENTLFDAAGRKVVRDFAAFYQRARAEHVTVFAAAGDDGSSNPTLDGVTFYPFPTVGFPASSPLVTAVGGTSLTADTSGNYQSEAVWNGYGAGGGGISQLFPLPDYQSFTLPGKTKKQLGGMRGVPDISYNADPLTAILVYLSFYGPDYAGYYGVGGTSAGAPQWAGIVADLNQYAGRPLGFLNPGLYALGGLGRFGTFGRDITVGDNAYNDVPGYSATKGWDLASGWGTPNLVALPTHVFELLDHSPR